MPSPILMAFLATLGTWGLTALGAAAVLFLKHPNPRLCNAMLGFAAGVMLASSYWSLLNPAIELSGNAGGLPPYAVVTLGFLAGVIFLVLADRVSDKLTPTGEIPAADGTALAEAKTRKRVKMLIFSITLHNIPEGLAVGVAFGALGTGGAGPEEWMGAFSIALGIGLQNFPEGAAVSLPLLREGCSRRKSFWIGQASGAVEPLAGVIGAASVLLIESILPYALSFAAGAMVLVAVHELIPECQQGRGASYYPTFGILLGFSLMMLLDVALG